MSVLRKQEMACSGVRTMGSFSFSEVLRMIGTPVFHESGLSAHGREELLGRETLCSRPLPSTCPSQLGMAARFSLRPGKTFSMLRADSSISNHSPTCLFQNTWSKGAEFFTRNLIRRKMMSRISDRRGSASNERLPRSRAPSSMRPWNQPTTFPSRSRSVVVSNGAVSR